MVEAALNAAAEAIVEFGASGRVLERMGNRSRFAAPQGLYACAGSQPGQEHWLALSVETDAQWRALLDVLGRPPWAAATAFDSHAGRLTHHDEIDAGLRPWIAEQARQPLLERLLAAGVPAASVADPRVASASPQHAARGFFEWAPHPVVGEQPIPTVPYRYASVAQWLRNPAPTLGQHNHELLSSLLGLGAEELAELEAEGIIGTRPPS
jgi:crotonobetainyl-CoA:carnitine CoA-transferase CaiB-like acyl-CoA transferase